MSRSIKMTSSLKLQLNKSEMKIVCAKSDFMSTSLKIKIAWKTKKNRARMRKMTNKNNRTPKPCINPSPRRPRLVNLQVTQSQH